MSHHCDEANIQFGHCCILSSLFLLQLDPPFSVLDEWKYNI
jgi:hypothetical protein